MNTKYHPIQALQGLPKDYSPEKHGFIDDTLCSEDTCYALDDYIKTGKHIFDIDPALSCLFRKTSIENVILEDLLSPYDGLYLHFGDVGIFAPEVDYLILEDGDQFEPHAVKLSGTQLVGAYVIFSKGIEPGINFTLVPEYGSDSFYSYDFSLSFHSLNGFIREHYTSSVLDNFHSSIHTNPFGNDIDNYRRGKRLAQAGLPNYSSGELEDIKKNWQPDAKQLAWEEPAALMLQLVVNSLLFLVSPDNDTVSEFPESAPKKLTKQACSSNLKEATRAESKLAALGYNKIHITGRSFKNAFSNNKTGQQKKSHWRKGHWRNQPYGENLQLRKLIWIKPVIINKSEDDEVNGNVYTTKV